MVFSTRPRWIALLIFVLAFAPRVLAHERFVTEDDVAFWTERTEHFLAAVEQGDFRATNLARHPAVTTMWMGSLGMLMNREMVSLGIRKAPVPQVVRWQTMRFPLEIVNALSVAIGYLLMCRLFKPRIALLAALLWAADPFVVAYSKVLGVDSPVMSFMALSLLGAMAAFLAPGHEDHPSAHWRFLVISAISGGLALLTKLPSLSLIPMVGLIAIVGQWPSLKQKGIRLGWRLLVLPLLVWGLIALAVFAALYPAVWVNLPRVLVKLREGLQLGAEAHEHGNFFMGQPVEDPGPFYYLVAIALRLTPWACLGLIAAASTLRWTAAGLRDRFEGQGRTLALLAFFVASFTIAMSLQAKKFDRYALPVFPPLDILAAFGLLVLADGLAAWARKAGAKLTPLRWFAPAVTFVTMPLIGWSAAVIVLALNLAAYHPYEMSYFNPLLGSGPTAVKMIMVGGGEGMEIAADYIHAQAPGCKNVVATADVIVSTLWPMSCDKVVKFDEINKADYAVLYVSFLQRHLYPEITDPLVSTLQPVYIVHLFGIDYAYIYDLTTPTPQPG
jgi:dolichyl-phosphate-mannose-protein mannosyltransferase